MTADGAAPCALAPDRWRIGTNALFWRGAGAPPYAYGPGSHARHQAALDGKARTVSNAALEFDIDDGEDIRLWSRLQPQTVAVAAAIPAARTPLNLEEISMNGDIPLARYGERER
jgi:hypothetical protein